MSSSRRYEFHFDIGNSTAGPLGLCARVWARTAEEAVSVLRAALPTDVDLPVSDGVTYITLYLNPDAITAKDIDAVDDNELCGEPGDG